MYSRKCKCWSCDQLHFAQTRKRRKNISTTFPPRASVHLQPLACCSKMALIMILILLVMLLMLTWCMMNVKKRPALPRSNCELPPTDHPCKPGSHQQSYCLLSKIPKSSTLSHSGRIFYLKNMRSPSKIELFTRGNQSVTISFSKDANKILPKKDVYLLQLCQELFNREASAEKKCFRTVENCS